MNNPTYSIAEMFFSVQGEGVHMGRAAYFVRLMGCDQACAFCDSAATWHRDWKPANGQRLTASQILEIIEKATAPIRANAEYESDVPFVVLTGGEPALYDLRPLVTALDEAKFKVHLETAGHKSVTAVHWKTVSPKFFATPPLRENMQRADEIKLICTSPAQLEADFVKIRELVGRRWGPIVWLHPEWSQRENPELLRAIIEKCKSEPGVRAGYQLHKLYAADWFDPNADRRFVPLGGKK